MALKFTKAVPSHHDEIYDLMLRTFMAYVQVVDSKATSGPYPWLQESIADGAVYVGSDGVAVVGMITTTRLGDDELGIDQLGVDPARQGQGIGGWLLDNLEKVARDEGLTTLSLQTAEMMTHLLRLYTRHGFVETHRALPEHGDDEHLRVHMVKRL